MLSDCDWGRAREEIRGGRPMQRASWPGNDFVSRDDGGEVLKHKGDGSLPEVYRPSLGDEMAEDWRQWG